MSKIAAVELGMFGSGTIKVKITVLPDTAFKDHNDLVLSSSCCKVRFGLDTVSFFRIGRYYRLDGFAPDTLNFFSLQANTFKNIKNARYDVKFLETLGIAPIYVLYTKTKKGTVFKVYAGKFNSYLDASNAKASLKRKGYKALVKKLEYAKS